MPKPRGTPLPLQRDAPSDLPAELVAEIEAAGGLWWASDYYTTAEQVVAQAREVGARALRLDFHDLSLLDELPDLEYLWLRSDGFPGLNPIARLRRLRALLIETGGVRGELDPLAFPELQWLELSLGGKLGQAFLAAIQRGHPSLRSLDVREARIRSLADLGGPFPELRRLSVRSADHLRDLGPLATMCPRLKTLALYMALPLSSIDGLAGLAPLQVLDLTGGRVTDLGVLGDLPGLRYVQLLQPRLASIEPLRGHPGIRMLSLAMAAEPDLDVLASIPGLVAVARHRGFDQSTPWPDLRELPRTDPLALEWSQALRA